MEEVCLYVDVACIIWLMMWIGCMLKEWFVVGFIAIKNRLDESTYPIGFNDFDNHSSKSRLHDESLHCTDAEEAVSSPAHYECHYMQASYKILNMCMKSLRPDVKGTVLDLL
jgi:hypothetical protein